MQRASSATRGIPQWVTRNKGRASGAIADNSGVEGNPSIQMRNATPWCSAVLTEASAKDALRIAREKFAAFMNTQIKYELKKQAGLK